MFRACFGLGDVVFVRAPRLGLYTIFAAQASPEPFTYFPQVAVDVSSVAAVVAGSGLLVETRRIC